jgi:hypothetical protein
MSDIQPETGFDLSDIGPDAKIAGFWLEAIIVSFPAKAFFNVNA